MLSFDDRIRHVSLKVARAKQHVGELEQHLKGFLANDPYKVAARREPSSKKLIYFVESVQPVPESLPLVAGDAIQNLMSALDHLAFQLVSKDTSDQPLNPRWIYFPIADDAKAYESKKWNRLEGASAETVEAVDALQPYKGGNDALWALWRLNNIEKHRLLLTVGSQAAGINLGQLIAGTVSDLFPAGAVSALESMNVFLNPADKGFPLQPGFELYIGAPNEEPNPKQQFRFDVVLNEPEICEGEPLLTTVAEFATAVESCVAKLSPILK